jgi:hypothetical protein
MPDPKPKAESPVANEAPPNLIAKLAEIAGLMAHIPKEGFNQAQKYKFVRESDVAEKASALLAERGIFLHQTVVTSSREPLYTTGSGSQMWLTHVEMAFQFIDASGEVSPVAVFHGDGADTGDKGIYKAMTGAEKYFLMKTFLVSTGDDPEGDEKVDKEAAAAGAAKGPVRVGKSAVAGAGRGGKSTLVTSAQIKEIVGLVTKLELDADAFGNVIHKVTGIDTEGKTSKEIFAGLTSDQAAGIVTALMAMDTFDEPAEALGAPEEPPQEDATEPMPVV